MAQEKLSLTAAITESNGELGYTRNYVRHVMMQNVLKVNPGIHKTIAKKVRADEHSTLATV